MIREIAIKVNSLFWSNYRAAFSEEQLKDMEKLSSENGVEVYWLCFHNIAYIAKILNGKPVEVCREKC